MKTLGYTFEFEAGADHHFSVEGHRTSTQNGEGKETDLDEDITIRYAGRSMKILNGKLTAGERDLGAVKPGDRITMTQAGTVSVNGAER